MDTSKGSKYVVERKERICRHVYNILGSETKMHLTGDLGHTEDREKLAPDILVNTR